MNKDQYNQYKLLKHIDRLKAWERGEVVYPIFADFNLTNKCNNRCPLCVSSESRDNTTASFDDAINVISQLKDGGVKSVYFAGGGDPTCHPNLEEIIRFTKSKDMDVAVCTNGYKMSDGVIDAIIDCCSWMRISLDADSAEMYKKTHGMSGDAFFGVLENMSKLVEARKKSKTDIVLGATYLIGPETVSGIYNAANICKTTGIDEIRFRPFFEWMNNTKFPEKEKKIMFQNFEICNKLNSDTFSVSYPAGRLGAIIEKKNRLYDKCYVPHVITAVSADLKLYPCCVLRNNSKYCLGDLKEKSFREVLESSEHRRVHEKIDLKDCPNPCQYEQHNKILNAVIEKITHSNFL